ncbi:hypothetical protein [Rheinheimera sp. MM224]|uniref:hypothetical protein n=1 Tax=Rheinheimera sp. MM224 TaxID=3019969 RepID=UPI0021F83827|nr:hypothetical protein [Rheinheimera sp. MM224]CAI3805883.1 hypothetical protein JAMGFMIE_03995 [Rheinheimera sp. MM224]
MKHLLLALVVLVSGCASTTEQPTQVELTGKLLGSYVSTSSGLLKGTILYITDPDSLQRISAVGNGNPNQVLLSHKDQAFLSKFAGNTVKVTGELNTQHSDPFHTDFELKVQEIAEQK